MNTYNLNNNFSACCVCIERFNYKNIDIYFLLTIRCLILSSRSSITFLI